MKTKISIATLLAVSVLVLAGCQSSATSLAAGIPAASKLLTETEAQHIALQDAGFTADTVTNLHVEKDVDDGITKYEVDFRQGDYEYDYEIDAATGKIIGYDKDLNPIATAPKPTEPAITEPAPTEPVATTKPANTQKTITKENAKAIALKHAGLKESEVTGLRISLDKDDGRTYYDVDFRKGNIEYDYEINASTGKIVEWDKDLDD